MYGIAGTNTFRLSSSKILQNKRAGFEGWGENLQNKAKNIRHMYIPDDGYKFLQCDQSGAEALIVAYLAPIGIFRDLFINNIKPHVYVALHMFKDDWKLNDKTIDWDGLCALKPKDLRPHPNFKAADKLIKSSDDWPASKRFYYMAKQTCHSANYDIKAPTFRLNVLDKSDGKIALTKQMSEYFLEFYRTTFPEIPALNEETKSIVEKTRTLYNLFNHPRYFAGVFSNSMFQETYAFRPQSTVGEITHRAYCGLQSTIEDNKLDWDILANTHDSYLVQCPDSSIEEQECAKQMKFFMEQELVGRDGVKFKMKSDVASGYNWGPYKKNVNERGLKEL
jgi:DNA polymerase I-like protein with 3'-5' exonuclease and polymerase domains